MPALFWLIAGAVTRFLSTSVVAWVAFKAFLLTLFVVVMPIVLKNLLILIMSEIMAALPDGSGSGFDSFIISLSGVGAYLGGCFQLPLCFSIIISASLYRLTINLIPFIK